MSWVRNFGHSRFRRVSFCDNNSKITNMEKKINAVCVGLKKEGVPPEKVDIRYVQTFVDGVRKLKLIIKVAGG